MIVVSDSTPMISLMKMDKLSLLEKLYGEIIIPTAVYRELTTNNRFPEEAMLIQASDFIKRVDVSNPKEVELIQRYSGLDLGESEAIAYTKEANADLLFMDEARGRAVARQMGLPIIGTLGILKQAYANDLLTKEEAIDCVIKLKENRRYIGDNLIWAFVASLD